MCPIHVGNCQATALAQDGPKYDSGNGAVFAAMHRDDKIIFPLVVVISSLVSQIQLTWGEHHLSISGICHWQVRHWGDFKKTDPVDPHATWHQQWGQGIQGEGSNDCVGNWDGNAASSSCYSTCQKNLAICEVLRLWCLPWNTIFWVEFLAFRINIKSFNFPSIQRTPAQKSK